MISGIESARLKVKRATVHIEALKQYLRDYIANEPSLISTQPDGTKKLHFVADPPPDIAILVGEAVYQLRSALDHLAFDLVKANPNKVSLPEKWFERCEFPLWTTVPLTGKPPSRTLPLPCNAFEKSLPGITKGAFAIIEGLQPYHGGNGLPHLGWLKELSNIDKHRYLHIVVPQAYQVEYIRSHGFSSEVIARLQNGAELKAVLHSDSELADAMHVEGGIAHPFVSFDESTLGDYAADLSVDNILEVCAETISTVIIPAFEKLIKSP